MVCEQCVHEVIVEGAQRRGTGVVVLVGSGEREERSTAT